VFLVHLSVQIFKHINKVERDENTCEFLLMKLKG
jgi:hypothetical protein